MTSKTSKTGKTVQTISLSEAQLVLLSSAAQRRERA